MKAIYNVRHNIAYYVWLKSDLDMIIAIYVAPSLSRIFFKWFGFPMFWLWANMMNVISEKRRVHYVR
jgi:hypothetical protein